MAHDHHHHGESLREYFTEQLLTIFVVGLFGAVAVLMYTSGKLNFVLAAQFHMPVLIGGIAVLALVALRAASVWREAGEAPADEHDHHHDHGHSHSHPHDHDHDHAHHHREHGPGCEQDHHHHDHDHAHGHAHDQDHHHHDHDHAAEDHGHSHDLAWVFARMLVLFFPVALFIIGVPNSSFSQDWINKHLLGSEEQISADVGNVARGQGTGMSFGDLNDAAYNDAKRETLQGQIGILEGQYRRLAERQFTLYRLKITCCNADMVPLKVRIVTPRPLSGFADGEWVRVKGEIRFVQPPGSTEYIPVIAVADMNDIKPIPPQQ